MNIVDNVVYAVAAYLGRHYPKFWISFRYFLRFHKFINWRNPRTLNEKILHLSFNTDTMQWSDLSDKYLVREYIADCGYADSLVTLYGVWDDANKIDFNKLPQSFVLKTNHGSGEIVIVKDKNKIDKDDIITYLNSEISRPYGEIESGKHYWRIKPCIIAEQLLVNDENSQRSSTSIIDYKFWCFDGKVYYIYTCFNRTKKALDVLLYDREWNAHPEYSIFTKHYRKGNILPKPQSLNEMILMAEKLANPFPCVRVDLYNIGGKIYFGEMTFTSLGGLMNYFTEEFLMKAGDLIDLNYAANNSN